MTPDQEQLVLDNAPLAKSLAWQLWQSCSSVRSVGGIEDCRQAAMLGLVKAAVVFDPSRGVKFSTLAWQCIRNAVLSSARHRRPVDLTSACPYPDDEDFLESPDASAHDSLATGESNASLRRAIACLNDTERHLVRRFYGIDAPAATTRELAEEMKISRQAVSRRILVARGKMRAILTDFTNPERE